MGDLTGSDRFRRRPGRLTVRREIGTKVDALKKTEGNTAPQTAPESPGEDSPKEGKRKRFSLGIRRRWMTNSIVVVLLILLAAGGIMIAMMQYSYNQTIRERLETQAGTAANFLKNYESEQEFLTASRYYMNNDFTDARVEFQVLNSDGRVLMSSLLDTPRPGAGTPDIETALTERSVSSWRGYDPSTGEHVMAASAPVIYDGNVVGVIRMVTSLRLVDSQILRLTALVAAVCAAILVLVWLTNLYFVRSILDPVSRVTETAKRIAAGSYGIQMEKKSNDEMGQLMDAINDMSMKIDQAEKTQSEFISSVSHELRTPLTAISGWAETLYQGEVRNAEDVRKGMGIIVSESRRLTNMVEELLEFSRIEAGRFNLSVEPLDLTAELEDAVYTYREFFQRKGLLLEYREPEEEIPQISGDPERLRQVFCNLLDNADKHGGSGGKVEVSAFREENSAVIRIRDYGPGIPEEELPHVKYKFYKGSSKARGSGIGLAVCDEIITRHNGTLELGNAEGGGCVVTIRLPLEGA